MRGVSPIVVALIAISAGGARAQQVVPASLGELARHTEAASATTRKAKKTYTNGDLLPVSGGEPASTATTEGYVSKTLGAPVTAEEMVVRSVDKIEKDVVAQQKEDVWRSRADAVRLQIEKLQTRVAALTKPNPARDAIPAAVARNEAEVNSARAALDGLRQQWARLEDAARTAKIPSPWLEPRPQFQ